MNKLKFILLILIFGFISCTKEEINESGSYTSVITGEFPILYEGIENGIGGVEKEIMLWGSKAWVLDTGDNYIFQGDIVLDKARIDTLKQTESTRAAAIRDRLWPNGRIDYKYSSNVTTNDKIMIETAIRDIQTHIPVYFYHNEQARNYVLFTRGDGIYTDYVGYNGGGQQRIVYNNNAGTGNIIHEICHVLGLFHEHTREDRDRHIRIDWNRISTDRNERAQYQQYSVLGYNGYDYGEFDFNSIMLYPSALINGGWDMVRVSNGESFGAQRNGLSPNDREALRDKYWRCLKIVRTNINGSDVTCSVPNMPSGATIRWQASGSILNGQNTSSATFRSDFIELNVRAIISYQQQTLTLEENILLPNLPPYLKDLNFYNRDYGQNVIYIGESSWLCIDDIDRQKASVQGVTEFKWDFKSYSQYLDVQDAEGYIRGEGVFVTARHNIPYYGTQIVEVTPVNRHGEGVSTARTFEIKHKW